MRKQKVLTSRSKKKASTIGTAAGGAVSKYEHKLLWDFVRATRVALDAQCQGHNQWQKVQDVSDRLEDEFADPEDM